MREQAVNKAIEAIREFVSGDGLFDNVEDAGDGVIGCTVDGISVSITISETA
jgi:hypothetical protein